MSENEEHRGQMKDSRTPPPSGYRPPRPPISGPPAQAPSFGGPPPAAPAADQQPVSPVEDAGEVAAQPGPQGAASEEMPAGSPSTDREDQEHSKYAPAPDVSLRVPGFMKPLTARHWLTLLASQALAYAALLGLALLSVIALAIGALLEGGEDLSAQVVEASGGLDLTPSLFIILLTLPFQIAAVWLFGTFHFSLTVPDSLSQLLPGDDGMGMSIWAPNLVFVVLAAGLALWVGRIWFRRSPAPDLARMPRLARVVANLVTAAVLAALTVTVTWALSYRESFDLAEMAAAEGASSAEIQQMAEFLGLDPTDLAISMNGNAASVSLFVGAFAVYLVIGLMLSVHPRMLSRVGLKAQYYLPSLVQAPRVLAAHAVIVVIPALVYAAVAFTVEAGVLGASSFFFWAWHAAVIGFVLLSFGAVSGAGTVAEFGQSTAGAETAYLWTADFEWWVVALGVVVALVAIAVASLVWRQRRDSRGSTLDNLLSWLTLPLVYAAAGLGLTLFGQIRGAFEAFGAVSADFHLAPAWWTLVIMLLIGVLIEVLSRFVAPSLDQKLPGVLRRALGGPARTR